MRAPGGVQRYRLLAVAITLLALVLRLYRFGELPPGLFYDEAFNVLDGLAVLGGGYHPVFFAGNNGREALYIYLQSIFVALGGTAPFVVRLPSIFLGTMTVALTYPLVRRLLAREERSRREMVALLATFLLATLEWHLNFSRIGFRAIGQPFFEALVVYLLYRGAQELEGRSAAPHRVVSPTRFGRAGTPAPTGDVLYRGAQEREQRSMGRRWWVWFALGGGALGLALYTYLSARLLPPGVFALGIVAVIWGQRISRRYLAGVLVTAATFAAASAPLGWYFYQHPDLFVGHSKDVSLLSFGGYDLLLENAGRLAGMFNLAGDGNWRHNLSGRPVFDLVAGIFFLAGVGLAGYRLARDWRRPTLAPNSYLAPLVIVPVMLLPTLLSEGAPHFLRGIGVLPFLVIFPALGLEGGWRLLRRAMGSGAWRAQLPQVALAAVLVFTTAATFKGYFLDWGSREEPYYYFDARYFEFARYVEAQDAQTRVYLSPWLATHATARLLLRDRPFASFDSDRTMVLSAKEALYAFEEWGVDRDRAAAFPERLPLPLQAEHLPDRYGRTSFGFYRLPAASPGAAGSPEVLARLLGPLQRPANTPADVPVSFGDDLTLLGLAVGQQQSGGEVEVSPGITLPVTLVWRATRPPADDYTVSLRLTDATGHSWLQSDSLAGGSSYPTSHWQTDETVIDWPPLVPPADLPPGEYRLEAAVYSLARKATSEFKVGGQGRGELATLATVRVARPSPDALAAMHPPTVLGAAFGPQLTLLGYGLSRPSVKPGEPLDVSLFWKAERDVDRDLAVDVRLLDANGQTVAARQAAPDNGNYPTSRWRAGDALRDTHRLTLGAQAAPGAATLRVALVDSANGTTIEAVDVAGVEITGRERVFAAPAPPFATATKFGDKVELLGFAGGEGVAQGGDGSPRLAAQAGGALPITLSWRALGEMETSYTVFVQLLNAQGQLVAQHDGPPHDGEAPTSSWLAGEVVSDRHSLALRPDLPSGDYTLIAGLYNAADGKRLPAGQSDFVKLATVAVEGR